MDFKKIEAFLTVASQKQFTSAAEKLYTSQSALSKQIKQLEREVGAPLFKKTSTGVELTQAGWEFYYYARHALPELQQTLAHIEALESDAKAHFRLGSLPLVEDYGFSDCFCSFWAQTPSVQIDYFERSQEDLVTKLEQSKLDLALARLDLLDRGRYAMRPVLTDELVVVVNEHNPLAGYEKLDFSLLRDEQFILPAERSDLARVFTSACEEHGFHPDVPLRHSRHRMLLKAVQRNMGTTVLPRGMTSPAHAKGVVRIPLAEPIRTTIGFAWLAGVSLGQIAQQFMDYVCAEYNR